MLPALAVARELRRQGVANEEIHFVGSARGIEGRLVPDDGFSITLLAGRGIQRKVSWQNVKSAVSLVGATGRAFALLARRRPAVLFSVGGYASLPCALSAVVLRIPLVIADSNARVGAANRMVSRFAKSAAVAFEGTGLPRAHNVGNPVRAEILALGTGDRVVARENARKELGYHATNPLIVVFGGSLGARRINEATFGAVETWTNRAMAIHHVMGERDYEDAQKWLSTWRGAHPDARIEYRQIRYEDRMDLVYAAADLVICRAGGTSIADLAIAGLPAILVPLPIAAEDHQTENAKAVVADRAAISIADREFDTKRLIKEVELLLSQPEQLHAMGEAQRSRARPNAARDVVALIRAAAKGPSQGRAVNNVSATTNSEASHDS